MHLARRTASVATACPGGTKFWETDASSGNFEITFSNTLAAFGFYGIDMGDFAGTLKLELYNAGNALVSSQDITTVRTGGSILYYGVVAANASEEFSKGALRFHGWLGRLLRLRQLHHRHP
jgi:hypothetical protein